MLLPGGSGKNRFPCLFQSLLVFLGEGLLPPSSKPAAQHLQTSLALFLPFPLIRTAGLTLGPSGQSRIISPYQDQLDSNLNSICNLNSPLPSIIIYSQAPGIRMWTLLEAMVLPTNSISPLLRSVPVMYQVFNRYLLNE